MAWQHVPTLPGLFFFKKSIGQRGRVEIWVRPSFPSDQHFVAVFVGGLFGHGDGRATAKITDQPVVALIVARND